MSEYQPNQSGGELPPRPGIESLAVSSEDPTVLARWEDCLRRYGDAFVAFTQLRLPETFTDDVIETFESLYGGSYDNLTEAAVVQIDALGWKAALYRLRREQAISDDLLDWNYDAVIRRLAEIYQFVRAGGQVHFFAK